MKVQSLIRSAWLAPLLAILGGGCGARSLDPRDADVMPGVDAAADRDLGGDDTGDASPTDATDAGSPTDVGPNTGEAPVRVNGAWIYAATASGVQRADTAGGGFAPFGVAASTRSVFPSPSGRFVAQELADERVVVFDHGGEQRGYFDQRMGLLGWSDDATLLFLDPLTKFLRQLSPDSPARRYLPLPPGLNAYGYRSALVSPDRSLVAVLAEPFARDNVVGYYLLVLSMVDGSLVRDLGVLSRGGLAWTGDGRLVITAPTGQGFVAVNARSGASTPVSATSALGSACGYVGWYEAGKILLGKFFSQPGSDTATCIPSSLFDVDTAVVSPGPTTSAFLATAFAQSADGREAAIALGASIELGAVAGGTRRLLGEATDAIIGVAWAHPTGGDAPSLTSPGFPVRSAGLAGAPAAADRSGGADCGTGRWVNRTPSPLPAGWPAARRAFSFAFDSDRGTLLVEGGLAGNLGTLPNVDYETLQWDGAQGEWLNFSRADGFGPVNGRPMGYDARHQVVLALGADLPSDGPWTWSPPLGWKNLRAAPPSYQGPRAASAATVYDLGRDRWIVSGGYAESATWEWDGAAWARSTAAPPGGTTQLAGSRLVYDDARARVYSVGNRDRGASPWLYEPAQSRWTAAPSSGPSPLPREWAGVAYDVRRDRVMLFGGYALNGAGGANIGGDLYEWDPASGAWQACPATGAAPAARMNAAFAYDRTRDVLLLFGGETADGSVATDVWEWYVP